MQHLMYLKMLQSFLENHESIIKIVSTYFKSELGFSPDFKMKQCCLHLIDIFWLKTHPKFPLRIQHPTYL